jgi:tetratricopeptide (TPR) repeat protein
MLKIILTLFVLASLTLSDTQAQKRQLDSLRVVLKSTEVDSQRVSILNEIAYQNININPAIAKDDVIIAYNEAERINYTGGQARSLVVMGGVYWGFGEYKEALSYYLDALEQYRKLDDIKGRSDCLNNIGEVYKKLGEYNSALDYLQQALRLKEEIEGKGNALLIYSNLGELYALMGEFNKAEAHYMIALEGAKRKDDKKTLSYASDGLGLLFYQKKNYKNSIPYLQQAVTIREASHDIRGNSYSYTNLGRTYSKLGILDSADYYFQKGLIAAKQSHANDVRANIYKYISELDSLKGNYYQSYLNFKLHSQLKDSLYNTEKAAQIAKLQTDYEMDILQRDNKAKHLEVRQKNTMIIAVIMLLILTLALAYAFHKQRTVQKNANDLLTTKNVEIEKKNIEIQAQSVQLQTLNDNLANLNQNLEEKIKLRTELLREQNKVLSEYAFVHAHELRAPIANILGLVELLRHSEMSNKDGVIIKHLYTATAELDQVIKKIASQLDNENDIKSID